MSSTMNWRPADDHRDDRMIPTSLKNILKEHCGEILGSGDIGYLEGLRDAGVEGADELVDAVIKHDSIIISEVW